MLTAGTAFALLALVAISFEMTGSAAAFGAVAYFLIAHCA
jgi:hypothetical protein